MRWRVIVAMFGAALAVAGGPAAAQVYEYSYIGQPFQANTLPGATDITVQFQSQGLLAPSTTYLIAPDGTLAPQFSQLSMSDGAETISPGNGTFLDTDFVTTNSSGAIATWQIVELAGAGRTFAVGQCCTINDPPFMYTYCCSGPTDATIQTNGFFVTGGKGYAYNNQLPGVWSVASTSPPIDLTVFGKLFLGDSQVNDFAARGGSTFAANRAGDGGVFTYTDPSDGTFSADFSTTAVSIAVGKGVWKEIFLVKTPGFFDALAGMCPSGPQTGRLICHVGDNGEFLWVRGVGAPAGPAIFTYGGSAAEPLSAIGVPEPWAWMMMLVGVGAVGAAMRRRPAARRLAA